ncbi:Solute carrier family 25 member 26 [Fasciola gigantica]|uniref:Solute carrier family 25 member 26 n=1 Tax=Fasciola gigantica TaxID=46835 RepID=A0A504YHY1_FASGI|nr:Solute carrier family 25 member 26 [Fasciola gigantica]
MSDKSFTALLAGATAGLCVDLTLFPIDTLKTRIQSAQHGIHRTPGSLRLFAGLPAVVVGSAPGAAAFFLTYEAIKAKSSDIGFRPSISHIFAACFAEMVACIVRVPCEVVKQRAQNSPHISVSHILLNTLRAEGLRGLYRGYLSTVAREVPFSFIQYPVWEQLKAFGLRWNMRHGADKCTELTYWQSALCGSLAGCTAGTITTPLDVAKTRIMLAEPGTSLASGHLGDALRLVFHERGVHGLFAGLVPRVAFLSLGGAIFLGTYDISSNLWNRLISSK